jgi:hypothetical protein
MGKMQGPLMLKEVVHIETTIHRSVIQRLASMCFVQNVHEMKAHRDSCISLSISVHIVTYPGFS